MIKILLGGSPCTYWSIAQHKEKKETEAEGLGWELFKNYVIAKDKFAPDYFLYENNKSAAKAIKEQIQEKLGKDLMYINSALVSAQNRQRFYIFNWEVEQPNDRKIYICDILENGEKQKSEVRKDTTICLNSKSGRAGIEGLQPSLQDRIYGIEGKATAVTTAFMPKIAIPIEGKDKTGTKKIYEVKDGMVEMNGRRFPIKLPNGLYEIRQLTCIEAERCQTLPDNYTAGVSNAQRYKGIGNGWTAEVIIHILQGALKDVPKDEEIVVLSMYDGIGTGRYCLDKMGFENVKYFAYEIDEYAKKIAMKNYPDIIQMGDAFQVREDNWKLEI